MNEKNWSEPRLILMIIVIVAAVGYDCAVSFLKPSVDPTIIGTILGFLNGTGLASVIQYYFGSSKSSTDKDATIDKAVKP